MSTRPHGIGEGHILTPIALACAAGLWLAFGHRPDFDLLGTTGSSVHKLTIFSAYVLVFLFAFGGWKFRVVHELKGNLLAFAILAAAVVLGAALCLVN